MGSLLQCKLVAQLAFKAGGDVFHHLLANKPHHLAKINPGKVQACDLVQGSHGANDSVIQWKFTVDGKEHTAKEVLQDIDEEKKTISWKVVEGDLLDASKSMIISAHVETKGGVDFITWTLEYELRTPDSPHPLPFLNFLIEVTKEIETHIFG